MDVRRFGNTDLRVSEYGLGCARIGGIFQRDSAGFLDLLTAARDAGIVFHYEHAFGHGHYLYSMTVERPLSVVKVGRVDAPYILNGQARTIGKYYEGRMPGRRPSYHSRRLQQLHRLTLLLSLVLRTMSP
jgi:hypothetical protein